MLFTQGIFLIVFQKDYLDNVRQRFDIDLATADIVYPNDCDYEY